MLPGPRIERRSTHCAQRSASGNRIAEIGDRLSIFKPLRRSSSLIHRRFSGESAVRRKVGAQSPASRTTHGRNALSRRPARPLEIFARDQPRSRSRTSRRLGGPQGHRRGRHRRFHPSGLARRTERQARAGGAGPVPPAARDRAGDRARIAAGVPGAGALHALGRNLHDLQEGRKDPKNPSPDLCAGFRHRRPHFRPPRPHRQHRLRRAADPRPQLARSSGDHADVEPGRLFHSGAYLDAVVRRARLAIGLRLHQGMLRRSRRSHLRGRDRTVLRSADELAAVDARPLSPGVQFGRPFARKARPRGDHVRLRARLFRHPQGAGDRRGLCRHRRVLSRGRQIPSRRPSQMRHQAFAARDARPGRPLPGLRRRR